jgi:nucleotide-binding universal stress UspA family protein
MLPEIKKILYATDLSENAKHAFGYAASIAQRYGSTITILHVVEELSKNTEHLLSSMLGDERWKEIQEKSSGEFSDLIRERLDQFCREMDKAHAECTLPVKEIRIRQGTPVRQIINEAHEGGYDLVVMGTHGQGGITDAMMGSTARRVTRRSKVPVMVICLPE